MIKLREGIKKQAILGIFYRAVGMAAAYASVRLLINYLGTEQYGLWVTISSIFGWFAFFDIGMGSGLQNKLIESYADGDNNLSRRLITTTYVTTAMIAAIVFIAGAIIIRLLPTGTLIDTLGLDETVIRRILTIMIGSSMTLMVLNLNTRIFNSLKQTSRSLLAATAGNILFAAALLILIYGKSGSSLTFTASVKAGAGIVVAGIVTIILFKLNPGLKPSAGYYDKTLVRRITAIGIQFFIIQICFTIILSTDNVIISNRLGSAEVTPYSLVNRLLMLGKTGFFLLLTPFWPQFSEYYYQKNTEKMTNLLKKYIILLIIIIACIIAASFFTRDIIRIWTGREFEISNKLIIFTVLFVIIDNTTALFTYCLNAISRVKLQMYLFIAGALINIPLSLLLIKPFGSTGVIIASCICYIPLVTIMPIQVIYEIRKTAKCSPE